MTSEDHIKARLYQNFQEVYELDQGLDRKFDFKFGSVEYWSLVNQYIDFILNKTNGDIKPFNSLFAYYYHRLSDDVKLILDKVTLQQ